MCTQIAFTCSALQKSIFKQYPVHFTLINSNPTLREAFSSPNNKIEQDILMFMYNVQLE